MGSPMPRPLGSSLDTWFQMQKFLPSPGHHIGANSRAEWRHLSLQIFPKLCQDTLSLCDPTEHMSRFLKLIIDVLGKTALEVREFFFLLFLFLFFFPIVFSLLLWKEIIKYFLQGGKILACSLQVWKAKQGEMTWTACDHPSAKQGQIKVFWWSPKWAGSTLQLVVGLRAPLSRWGLLARMCYSFWYSCTNISSVQWKAKCR